MRILTALSLAISGLVGFPTFAADDPVNVLIIYADEYRYDCIGAAGNTEIQTPNLDALAADGVLYDNSFCVWPVCTPSRISLMTGQYVKQHGGSSNRSTVLPGTPTYASILRDAGYETTATALSWTFHLLARHPQVLRRVESEILDTVSDQMPTQAARK